MKIGLLAYSTNTGLGHQTLEFYEHLHPSKTLVVDLNRFNNMETHHERFNEGDVRVTLGIPKDSDCEWLTDNVDIVFVAETPLNYNLFEAAKRKGVIAIQQYNYEFLDYFRHPEWSNPTILAGPTKWNIEKVRALNIGKVIELPVPVNRNKIPFRQINKLETFVHVIGRPAYMDRNGTFTFLEAALRLNKKYRYKIYYQQPADVRAIEYFDPVLREINRAQELLGSNLEVIVDTEHYEDIYKSGDCLVLPRRYGGLCLPVHEALSAGIPVIMTDLSPNDDLLPKDWLVPAFLSGSFQFHVSVDVYSANKQALWETMEYIASDISRFNAQANQIAQSLSWDVLKDEYLNTFQTLLNERA